MRQRVTDGARIQALVAVWLVISCAELVVAGPDALPTPCAYDQAVLTETLTTGITYAHVRTELLAARTAYCAARADQLLDATCFGNTVRSQMALALTHATGSTLGLACVADVVATGWADTDVHLTGALTARPAHPPTSIAIFRSADGTRRHAADGAQQIVAASAQMDAAFTGKMAVTVDRCHRCFGAAHMTGRPTHNSSIAVLLDTHRHLVMSGRQCHFADRNRKLDGNIADQLDFHAQAMVLDLFGNFAIQVGFHRPAALTVRVTCWLHFTDLLRVISCQPVQRFVKAG